MAVKKRLPIEQLREVGKKAREMLVTKGILSKNSVIHKVLKDKNAPILPGIPAYIPKGWTIQVAQIIMRDFLIQWKEECKKKRYNVEDISTFFKFIVKESRRQERKFKREMDRMPSLIKAMKDIPVLAEVFSPLRKKETMHAMQRFYEDSFAVAIILKNATTVSEYANWFLDWTNDLFTTWTKLEQYLPNDIKPDERT